MSDVTYRGSIWSMTAALLALALAGGGFRVGDLGDIMGSSALALFCVHEILRQARPIIVISSAGLRWQPITLWNPEESALWKDVERVESTSFRMLTLTTRDGTSRRIPILGIAASERKEISKLISEHIEA